MRSMTAAFSADPERKYRAAVSMEACPSRAWTWAGSAPPWQLVESNIPTMLNTSAGAGHLEATSQVYDYGCGSARCIAGPCQERPPVGDCDRGGRVRGASARRRAAWLTGELAAA